MRWTHRLLLYVLPCVLCRKRRGEGGMASDGGNWETLEVEVDSLAMVARLTLNRPSRLNALNMRFFEELPLAISALDADPRVRVIILRASGNHFCSGIDLSTLGQITGNKEDNNDGDDGGAMKKKADGGRIRERLFRSIHMMQSAFTAIESCRKPVVALVHGACIGAGIDMITACDLRYCTEDASFSVKEIDLAIAADLGTLQRLPKLIGQGHTMELALTGRRFGHAEAARLGLVSATFPSKQSMEKEVGDLAKSIAMKSPLAVIGTKKVLLTSRDLSVAQALDYVAAWNAAMLMSTDLEEAVRSHLEKRKPFFSKL